jgi:predicted transporter
MLSRVPIWQIAFLELFLVAGSIALFGVLIHFPDVTRRPAPIVGGIYFILLATISAIAVGKLTTAAIHRARPTVAALIVLWTIVIVLAACYAFPFLWLNTFGS